jgi:hypothetical protein
MSLEDQIKNTCKALHSHRSEKGWCSVKLNAFIQAQALNIDDIEQRKTFLIKCRQYLNKQLLNR